MQRRTLLQFLLSGISVLGARVGLHGQAAALADVDVERLQTLARVVLPQEIGQTGHSRVVTSFVGWLRDYRPEAETDHGYGFPRLRRTPANPSAHYRAQLDALDVAAGRGRTFASLSLDEQRTIVEAAVLAAKVERLPSRPDGGHVATDLMGFFFDSAEANDLCYRAQIGRDACRGLSDSDDRPAPLSAGAR
jgi:hypothetical protein